MSVIVSNSKQLNKQQTKERKNSMKNKQETAVETASSQVIAARQSLRGEWGKVGAPPKDIIGLTVKKSRTNFTIKSIYALNAGTISELTIRNRIKALIEAKQLAKLAGGLKGEAAGAPAKQYSFDMKKADKPAKQPKTTKTGKTTRKTRTPKVAPVEVQPEAPAPAPETPAVVEPTQQTIEQAPVVDTAPVTPVVAEPVTA